MKIYYFVHGTTILGYEAPSYAAASKEAHKSFPKDRDIWGFGKPDGYDYPVSEQAIRAAEYLLRVRKNGGNLI